LIMKKFVGTYRDRRVKIEAISAGKAILTVSKIFGVKPTKVSVRQI